MFAEVDDAALPSVVVLSSVDVGEISPRVVSTAVDDSVLWTIVRLSLDLEELRSVLMSAEVDCNVLSAVVGLSSVVVGEPSSVVVSAAVDDSVL